MSSEAKRPRGRPRKVVYGSVDVPPPRLVVPVLAELRLSKAHRAVIQAIAREVEISPAIVLKDVINQGVPQVREMYADLIECRKRLEQRNSANGRGSNERPVSQSTDLHPSGLGRVDSFGDQGIGQIDSDAAIERGFQEEGDAAIETYSSDATLVSD